MNYIKGLFSGAGVYIKGMFLGAGIALYVAFIILLIAVGPFITIWALNTLFAFGILYTFKTWLAMLLIQTFFIRQKNNQKKN